MMLKTPIEEKQLDFNQPLLSVRRSTATVVSSEADDKRKTDKPLPKLPPLPVYKSELKSGPVRNPGTVPFVWEQIPGRPKDERKSQNQALERPPTTPKLPPGRVLNVKKQALDKRSRRTTAAQSPTANVPSNSQNVSTLNRKEASKYDSSKEGMDDNGIAGSADGDETYLDALDALSRSESFYMNCSVSGLSGLDGLDIKPSGTFSTDPQTQDFMMGRFLPAAKAMASETPQYATRKQPVAREQPISLEQPRGTKKVVSGDKQHPSNQYRPIAGDKSEDKDMRVQAKLPISSVRSVRAKSSYSSSYIEAKKEHFGGDACEQRLMNEHQEAGVPEDKNDLKRETNQISNKSDRQKFDVSPVYRRVQGSGISAYRNERFHHEEKGFLGFPEKGKNSRETRSSGKYQNSQISFRELLATENISEWEKDSGSPVVEKTLYIDSIHTVKSPNTKSRSCVTKGLIIDYRANGFEIPGKSNKVEETHLVASSFQDIEHLGDGNEKAIVPKGFEFPDSSFLSSSGRSDYDVQIDVRNGSIPNQDLIEDYSELASSKVADREKYNLESQQLAKSGHEENCDGLTPDCTTLTSTKRAAEKKIDLEIQQSGKSGTEKSSHVHIQNAIILTSSKVANKGKIDLECKRLVKFGNKKSPQGHNSQLPLGPPLPKSPSESWLKRTLPAISSRSSSSQSSLGSRIYTSSQASKTPSLDPKWETIVKTSKTHHGHLRFSEELLTTIPEA